MSWEAIGAIGEAFSAIGLFFVLMQVRFARAETRRSVVQHRSDALRDIYLHRATSERLLAARAKVQASFGLQGSGAFFSSLEERGFTFEEVGALFNDEMAMLLYRQSGILHIEQLPTGERYAFDAGIRQYYGRSPVGRLFYETMKPAINPDAVAYIDRVIAQAG